MIEKTTKEYGAIRIPQPLIEDLKVWRQAFIHADNRPMTYECMLNIMIDELKETKPEVYVEVCRLKNSGMKPDTIHKYLEKMAAWYIDSKVIQDYKAHKNLFTGRYYRLYYSNTVRFILLGLAIVLGIAAMVAVLWWLLPPFITVLTILIGLMVFGKEILFGR